MDDVRKIIILLLAAAGVVCWIGTVSYWLRAIKKVKAGVELFENPWLNLTEEGNRLTRRGIIYFAGGMLGGLTLVGVFSLWPK